MKVTAPASTWADVLKHAKKHTPDHHPIRLSVFEDGASWAFAYDGQSILALEIPNQDALTGTVHVEPDRLRNTAQSLSGQPMTVEQIGEEGSVRVQSSGAFEASFREGGTPEVDAPQRPMGIEDTWEAEALRGALQRTLPAVTDNEMESHLLGVHFDLPSGTVVATDRTRLSRVTVDDEMEWRNTVPESACERLLEVLPSGGDVEVVMGEEAFYVSWEGGALLAQLLDTHEQFPDYDKAIPSDEPFLEVTLQREPLVRALRRVSAYTSSDSRHMRMEWDGSFLVMRGGDPESRCGAHERLEVTNTRGNGLNATREDDTLAHLNPSYLLDQLQAFSCEHVALGFRGPREVISVVPSPEKTDGRTAGYVMPVVVEDEMKVPA